VILVFPAALQAGTCAELKGCLHAMEKGVERGFAATAHAAKGTEHAVVRTAKRIGHSG
jgi:hypothetical protein